jgi:hypothetical protein
MDEGKGPCQGGEKVTARRNEEGRIEIKDTVKK